MQKTTTLTRLRKLLSNVLPLLVFLVFSTSNSNAQYNNGSLGTGVLSKSGVSAPAGLQWHEMQNNLLPANLPPTNVSIAFDNSPIIGSSRVADDFTVPAGQIWNISKMTFYSVVLPPPPGVSPVTAIRVVIRNASPVGASTVVYGDLTTNRLGATSPANIITIANSQVPAPGTPPTLNFVVWKVEANVTTTLTAGTYWIEWQTVGGPGQRVFALMSQPVGVRTLPGYNSVSTFNNGPWGALNDNGGGVPVPVEQIFKIDYVNTGVCVNPTIPTITGNLNTCAGAPTTLTANGTLNSATNWFWYTGSCGGTPVGTGTSITVSPLVPTTYYVRGEGTCFPAGACASVTVNALTGSTASVLSQVQIPGPPILLINEGFTTVVPAGWVAQNNSQPVGLTGWFQGNAGVFPAQSGAATSYIAANFNNTTGTNIISNWLFAPSVLLKNGDIFTFYTRTTSGVFPDRLQVRMNTTNTGTNVGATNTSVGDYSNLLLDINPTYTSTGYPTAWTQFTITLSGLPPAGVNGRLAFRYFVEGAGPGGANSDYIGIDNVVYSTSGVLTPTTCTGSTANLKVDITGGLSPYTVVINRVPGGLLPPITNYVSGANIPITPGVTTTYNLVSVTSAAGCIGIGNSGTPTVTVSALPITPIAVSASPNGPLCAGSPTLLTVIGLPGTATFTSAGGLTIPSSGTATPYPLPLAVAGLPVGATVSSVVLTNLNHTWTGDIDVALTGPGGLAQGVMLLSDLGNDGNFDANNTTLTFVDGAPRVPAVNPLPSGTYRPTNDGAVSDVMPAPGPSLNVAVPLLTALNTPTMNGNWNLWVNDQVGGDLGNIASYTINFAFPPAPPPVGWTFLWSPAAGLSSTTGNPVAASPMTTTTYTVMGTAPSGCQTTTAITLTIWQLPAVVTNPVNVTGACAGTNVSFSVTGTGQNITYQWQESTTGAGGPWNNITNGGIYGGATTPTLTLTGITTGMNNNRYRCAISGTCPPTAFSTGALLTVSSLPVITITPAGPVCGGVAGINGVLLSTGSAAPPIPGAVTAASGTINLVVPDNTANGVSNSLTIAGVPANATITNVSVTLNNFSHTYPGDMIIHLRAPNGAILNLYKYGGGLFTGPASGVPTWGWYGAKVSQLGPVAWSTVAVAPFIYNNITAWKADAINTPVAGPTIQNPTGFISAATSFTDLYTTGPSTNGSWTLAMCDGGGGDIGTLASWNLTIDYTTPGGAGSPLTFTWSPAAGLFTNTIATLPYVAGTQTPQVYAAPVSTTVYTVTGTDGTTGCLNTNTVTVLYTPPAPTVTPAAVAMCLGDPAVLLRSSSSVTTNLSFPSGTVNVAVPDNTANGVNSTVTVSGIPANATISSMAVRLNMSHTYPGDMIFNLKPPTGTSILNLYKYAGGAFTGPASGVPTWGWYNASASSAGTANFNSVAVAPFIYGTTPIWRADLLNAPVAGVTVQNPTGFVSNAASWNDIYAVPANNANGVWTLAMADGGPGDVGTLSSWTLEISYVIGVPALPAVWSPVIGLFSDAIASTAYVAGTRVDSVWAKPTTIGANPYTVTVNGNGLNVLSSFTNPAPITIPSVGTGTPYPSNITVTGLPVTGTTVDNVVLRNMSHTWGNDIDILLQSPTGQNVVLMSDIGGTVAVPNATYTFRDGSPAMAAGAANPTGTYSPTNVDVADNWPAPGPGAFAQAAPALALFGNTANVNGLWKLFVVDDTGGDQGTIANGWGITFSAPTVGCLSPSRTVVVTVNQPLTVTAQPVAQTVCTDKVATFTVAIAGTGPYTYRWQVSTDGGNTFTNINNGGVYSGATSATLTITAPPVTMTGYVYRCSIQGALPCPAIFSFQRILTVNPLPTIVIGQAPYVVSLFPGLTYTINSTVSPSAADPNGGYTWLRNGVVVPNATTGSLNVDIDGLGSYQLRVRDVNGCTNISNTVIIKDSVSGKCFIYPNPNSGMFQVRYYSGANNTGLPRLLTVFDSKGDRVLTQVYTIGRPYDRMDVDMRRNGKGLYWVEIGDRNGNRLSMCRIVIQ